MCVDTRVALNGYPLLCFPSNLCFVSGRAVLVVHSQTNARPVCQQEGHLLVHPIY